MPDPTLVSSDWHNSIPLTDAAIVPDLINSTNDMVEHFLNLNQTWATTALATANAAVAAMATYKLPDVLPDPPPVPPVAASAYVGATFGSPGAPNLGPLTTEGPPPYTHVPVTVDTPTGDPGAYTPMLTGLSVPDSPLYTDIPMPVPPGLDLTFVVPDAPLKDYGNSPQFDPALMPTYVPQVLPTFSDPAPTFDTLPPTPFINWTEPVYASNIKDAVNAVLVEMLATGTGLPLTVEQALWDRARQREDAAALALVRKATEQWTSRGFNHPPGQLNGEMLALYDENQIKITQLSRDVAVQQADWIIKNRQFAVQHGISYEQVFTGLFMSIVDRNFQIAKFTVETTIQIYNMQIAAFNVEQQVYAQVLERKKMELEVAMFPLKVYQAQLEAAKIQTEIEVAEIQAFAAKVSAFNAQVEAYKAQVEAAVAKASMQKLKLDLFRAQVDGQVATINGQRSKFEAYTSRVGGEVAKGQLEETRVRAYTGQVQAYTARAEINFKRAQTQIETQKLDLEWAAANLQRIANWNNVQLSNIHANLSAYQAAIGLSTAVTESDRANRQVQFQATVELGKLNLGKYQAMLESWKARSAQIISLAGMQIEALKASGQIASNLAAGAMAGTHVSAGISAGASSNQSLANSRQESKSLSQATQDSVSVTFSHPYKPI